MASRSKTISELLVANKTITSLIEFIEHDEHLVFSDSKTKIPCNSAIQLVVSNTLFAVVETTEHLEYVAKVKISL